MLADLLQSMSDDSNGGDAVAELVVTALGSCGTHYICWKTRSGQYKQRSHGIPKRLETWLFPEDGSTRDFETLQVILSGEDEFWASDRNGELRSSSTESQRQLRRALTFSDDTPTSVGRRRMSRAVSISNDSERPRASTLPSEFPTTGRLSPAAAKSPVASRSPVGHSRSPSTDGKLRRLSAFPLAIQQQRRSWASRPRSIGYGNSEELAVLKELPSPQRDGVPSTNTFKPRRSSSQRCSCGSHREDPRAPVAVAVAKPKLKLKPGYTDASVQTEVEAEPEPETVEYEIRPRSYRHRYRESTSSTSTTSSSLDSYPSSHRSSFGTTMTRPDSCFFESTPNPVMMGRMQDYFRSGSYMLGAALTPQGLG